MRPEDLFTASDLTDGDWKSIAKEARLPREHWGEGWLRLASFGLMNRSTAVSVLATIASHQRLLVRYARMRQAA